MSEGTTPRAGAQKAWNQLMERCGYSCDECGCPEGFVGTVSCSNCGFIPKEARL